MGDFSTDNSKETIESYRHLPNISIFYNSKNFGSPFKQWKKGIKLAKGKYIWIAESDDYAQPTFLETMIEILNRGHDLAYCRRADNDQNRKATNSMNFKSILGNKVQFKLNINK